MYFINANKMSIEKIVSIIISEIVEAIMLVIALFAIFSFSEFPGKASIIAGIVSFCFLAGIGTPFII